MINVNLLGVDRRRVAPLMSAERRLAVACCVLFGVTSAALGWWEWSLRAEGRGLDRELAMAARESSQLRAPLTEAQHLETRRRQLVERIEVVTGLRAAQGVPVRLLDHFSRSLPPMLWLTTIQQQEALVTIEGRSATLGGIADFVQTLQSSPLLEKPLEIADARADDAGRPAEASGAGVIRFVVKARLALPPSSPARPIEAPHQTGEHAKPVAAPLARPSVDLARAPRGRGRLDREDLTRDQGFEAVKTSRSASVAGVGTRSTRGIG